MQSQLGAISDQMSVVAWSWNTDATSTASERMAQIVGQRLQFVRSEASVVEQDVIMSRSAGTLKVRRLGTEVTVTANSGANPLGT